jgi:type III secretory pathway lipoprotein EscJ
VIGDLDEPEANRVVSALEKAGIPARKQEDRRGRDVTWSVLVPDADGPAARELLESHAMPRPDQAGFAAVLEQSSIVPSPSREKLKESVARSQEVASALESLDGVVQATVIIADPVRASTGCIGSASEPRPSASVLIHHLGKPVVTDDEVRSLVAGAIPGVEPASVAVVFAETKTSGLPERSWQYVGPFAVANGSRAPLLIIIVLMAALNLGLGGWVVYSALRSRRRAARSSPQDAAGEPR